MKNLKTCPSYVVSSSPAWVTQRYPTSGRRGAGRGGGREQLCYLGELIRSSGVLVVGRGHCNSRVICANASAKRSDSFWSWVVSAASVKENSTTVP